MVKLIIEKEFEVVDLELGTIDQLLDELEERMPELFVGPVCPNENIGVHSCNCTYESGCRMLKEIKDL